LKNLPGHYFGQSMATHKKKKISSALWVEGGRRPEIIFGARGWTQLAFQLKAFSK
jgi:hypothetical protein